MSSNIYANNHFEEELELEIVEVESCLTFEETKAQCDDHDGSQRELQLASTSRTNHFNQISAVMEPKTTRCADNIKVSAFSE